MPRLDSPQFHAIVQQYEYTNNKKGRPMKLRARGNV